MQQQLGSVVFRVGRPRFPKPMNISSESLEMLSDAADARFGGIQSMVIEISGAMAI